MILFRPAAPGPALACEACSLLVDPSDHGREAHVAWHAALDAQLRELGEEIIPAALLRVVGDDALPPNVIELRDVWRGGL